MFNSFFSKKPTITILPHPEICPSGEIVKAVKGKSLAEALVGARVEISHSCQFQCACTTCHIHLMEGAQFVSPMSDDERKLVAMAHHPAQWSRLACQCVYGGGGDVVIEIIA